MNKILALLLVALLVSQASAGFSLKGLFDNGEDHGEDSGEDHGEDSGEFYGQWNDTVYSDNGEYIDQGEFNAQVYLYDNGEFQVYANFDRYFYNRTDLGENEYTKDKLEDWGEISHTGRREQGRSGPITQDEIIPLIMKRLKSKKIF